MSASTNAEFAIPVSVQIAAPWFTGTGVVPVWLVGVLLGLPEPVNEPLPSGRPSLSYEHVPDSIPGDLWKSYG